MTMDHLPIFVELLDRPCLVVGGGAVAERKVRELIDAGAVVTVVSPTVTAGLERLGDDGRIQLRAEAFTEAHLEDHWLVVAATADRELNTRVAGAATSKQRFCNVVDDAELCSFIMPAVVRRSPVTVAVSSGGRSPVVARWVKGLIETLLPERLGDVASLAGRWRQRVAEAITDVDQRRRFWERLLEGPVPERCYAGQERQAELVMEQALADWHQGDANSVGEAYLVGAGPGSADLITLRGRQLLSQAEVVLYDRLIGADVLDFARRDARKISVGKQPGQPSITQEQINRLLVQLVRSGKRVCRLKGGDPMIFGRGGEELEALAAAGLPFQVVPGVSAFAGCAAYAGIPLTLRGVARSVVLTTGHTEDSGQYDLAPLRSDQTLALYMGVAQYGEIATQLIDNGSDPETPVAVVEHGTMQTQRVISTVLGKLAEAAATLEIKAPALLLVGETTRFAERYAWFAPESLVVYKGSGHEPLVRVS